MRRDHHGPATQPRRLPGLPVVTAVAALLLANGCDSPQADRGNDTARVCQNDKGVRVPDAACTSGRAGHAFMFLPLLRAPAMGGAVVGGVSSPANVTRGGFGMSAHGGGGGGGGE